MRTSKKDLSGLTEIERIEYRKAYHRKYYMRTTDGTRRRVKVHTPQERKERKAAMDKARYARNPEKNRDQCHAWHIRNQDKRRADKLWARYKILPEDRAQRLALQGGHCVFCARTEDLVVDHDHLTMRFRGVLCRGHNRALKVFGDNEAGFLKALAYLQGPPLV